VLAVYGRTLVLGAHYQGVFEALNKLRAHVRASECVPKEQFEPEQERFLAYREAVVAHMIRAMGLLSRRVWRAEVQAAENRLAAVE
jgi:hypothetical protein